MKKYVVGIVALALALVGVGAAPAQASISDWDFLNQWLSAPGTDSKLYEGTLNIVADAALDSPITVNGTKTIILPFAFSVDSSALNAPTFYLAPGASLTVDSSVGLTLRSQGGNTVFSGPGTVNVGDSSWPGKVTAGNNTLFGNTGGTTLAASSVVTLGTIALGAGTGTINNYGDVEASSFTSPSSLNNYGTVHSTGDFTVPASGYYGNNSSSASTMVGGVFTVDSDAIVNDIGSISATKFINNSSIIVTSTGSLSATTNSTNSGSIIANGILSVGAANTLDNTGTIFPGPTGITGTVLHNNYTISYTTVGTQAAIPSITLYAPTYHDYLASIPWPTDATNNFLGWKIGSGALTDTTDLATSATSGGTTALTEMTGAFGTGTPVAGAAYTGFTGTVGGAASYVYKVAGIQVQSSGSANYTPQPTDLGGDLTLDVQVTMPSGYDPISTTYSHDFGTVSGTFSQIGTNTASIAGLAAVGSTLVGDASNVYTPSPNYTYVWYQDSVFGTQVGTGLTYVPTTADIGHVVVFAAFGTLPFYNSVVTAAYTASVVAQPVLTLGSTNPNAGDAITISAPGLEPNTDYTVELHSSPVVLRVLHSSGAGLLSGSVTIPSNAVGGAHSIVILDPRGNPVTSTALTVNGIGLASTGVMVSAAPLVGGWVVGLGLLLVMMARRRRLRVTRG